MSDDDERMERANRIRRMREGQRSNGDGKPADTDADAETADDAADSETADDAADTETDDGAADSEPTDDAADSEPTDDAADSETADDAADTQTDGETAATADEPSVDDDATERSVERTDDADGQPAAHTEQQARADGSEQQQEDSMTESSSTSDTEVSSETDDDAPDPQAIAQRAAQAASEVAGGGADDVTDAVATDAGTTTADEPAAGATTAAMQGATGVELPDQDEIDAAIEAAGGSVETVETTDADQGEHGPGTVNAAASTTEESTRVLEFTLGDEHYCIDISLVEEIVKRDSITRVPNTDEYIEGVVDLRGQITTILDPKALMDIDAEGSETLMIVFDPDAFDDQGALGWIVDEVRQVAPITESEVNQPPVDEDYIRGVVDREDSEEFVIWTKPEVAIKLATIDEAED